MSKKRLVGTCGVDSGMIFIGDPCYFKHCEAFCDPDKWSENKQLKQTDDLPKQFYSDKKRDWQFPMGVLTSTNFGDGVYPVYVTFDKDNRPTKLEIKFT